MNVADARRLYEINLMLIGWRGVLCVQINKFVRFELNIVRSVNDAMFFGI